MALTPLSPNYGSTCGPLRRLYLRFLISSVLCVVGCSAYQGAGQSFQPESHKTADGETVGEFPLVRQTEPSDCGPAALSAVMRYWGIDTTTEKVRRSTAPPEGGNVDAGALRDHARRVGLDAFLINAKLADLRQEVLAKRPIVVGMLKPYVGDQWLAHFEVVTGMDSERVYTMDPASGWRAYPVAGFVREWEKTKQLALVIAPR